MGALTLVSAPALEPVLLAEAKEHLRVDISTDDALITGLLLAAKGEVERLTSRRMITQTWKWTLDRFPEVRILVPRSTDSLKIPLAPISAINSVKTTDRLGVQAIFANINYVEDLVSEPARIVLKDGVTWPDPTDQLQEANGVEVEFVAGYGLTGLVVPEELSLAIKMMTAHFYENRESTTAVLMRDLPQGISALVAQHQSWNQFASTRVHSDQDENA